VRIGLSKQADKLLKILKSNPFQSYPTYEKLSGDLANYYSRRINIQHRLVYQVFPEKKIIKIIRMRSHYE
jgi:Txe/YoeB family toxin of toxin-antitoxin system